MYVPFVNVFDQWQTIIIFISIASMILGAVAAIGQNNIKRLIELRNSRNLQLPQIRVSYTVQSRNKHEIEMFKEKWQDVVDFIEFQETQNIQFDKLNENFLRYM